MYSIHTLKAAQLQSPFIVVAEATAPTTNKFRNKRSTLSLRHCVEAASSSLTQFQSSSNEYSKNLDKDVEVTREHLERPKKPKSRDRKSPRGFLK